MLSNFIVWGNSSHEYSLNNRNPQQNKFYYNKKDYCIVDYLQKKIDDVYIKDNCVLLKIEGELYKKGYFNWEIENFENKNNEYFNILKNGKEQVQKIDSFKNDDKNFQLEDISFGQNHVLILSAEGNVFSWGDNYYGQLGIDNQMIPKLLTPRKINFPNNLKIKKIFACKNNSFAIDTNKHLWAWGKYEYIKQDNSRNIYAPIKIFNDNKTVNKLIFMDERIIIQSEESGSKIEPKKERKKENKTKEIKDLKNSSNFKKNEENNNPNDSKNNEKPEVKIGSILKDNSQLLENSKNMVNDQDIKNENLDNNENEIKFKNQPKENIPSQEKKEGGNLIYFFMII